jgi:uncharacterized membrane-anchored protein
LSQSLDRKAIRWCNFTEPHALKTTVIREGEMKEQHLPLLGPRFWAALCLASVFGANMGDFFAHNIGLGHVAGLPFLVFGFALVMAIERFDRMAHETYYWLGIILVRTAATNLGDFFAGDLRIARSLLMAILAVVLALVIALAWRTRWKSLGGGPKAAVLSADAPYWLGMLLAGTLGTVMGDYSPTTCSSAMLWGRLC